MKHTILPDQYIYPPRTNTTIPRNETKYFANQGWKAQLKYNDTRTIIKYINGTVELWTRHQTKHKSYNPTTNLTEQLLNLRDKLQLSKTKITMLDGGLLHQKHPLIKNTIVIWDMLVKNNEHLIGTTYEERYNFLHENTNGYWQHTIPTLSPYTLGLRYDNNLFIPIYYEPHKWDHLWHLTNTLNAPYTYGTPQDTDYSISPILEGIVLKDPNGTLEYGFNKKNNDQWMVRSRIKTNRHTF